MEPQVITVWRVRYADEVVRLFGGTVYVPVGVVAHRYDINDPPDRHSAATDRFMQAVGLLRGYFYASEAAAQAQCDKERDTLRRNVETLQGCIASMFPQE